MKIQGRDSPPAPDQREGGQALASEEAASGVAALPTTKSPSPLLRPCPDASGCTLQINRAR